METFCTAGKGAGWQKQTVPPSSTRLRRVTFGPGGGRGPLLGNRSEARQRAKHLSSDYIRSDMLVVLSAKYQVAFKSDRPGALGAIGIFNYGLRFVRSVRRRGRIAASLTIFRVHREAE